MDDDGVTQGRDWKLVSSSQTVCGDGGSREE